MRMLTTDRGVWGSAFGACPACARVALMSHPRATTADARAQRRLRVDVMEDIERLFGRIVPPRPVMRRDKPEWRARSSRQRSAVPPRAACQRRLVVWVRAHPLRSTSALHLGDRQRRVVIKPERNIDDHHDHGPWAEEQHSEDEPGVLGYEDETQADDGDRKAARGDFLPSSLLSRVPVERNALRRRWCRTVELCGCGSFNELAHHAL